MVVTEYFGVIVEVVVVAVRCLINITVVGVIIVGVWAVGVYGVGIVCLFKECAEICVKEKVMCCDVIA